MPRPRRGHPWPRRGHLHPDPSPSEPRPPGAETLSLVEGHPGHVGAGLVEAQRRSRALCGAPARSASARVGAGLVEGSGVERSLAVLTHQSPVTSYESRVSLRGLIFHTDLWIDLIPKTCRGGACRSAAKTPSGVEGPLADMASVGQTFVSALHREGTACPVSANLTTPPRQSHLPAVALA